jgi:hypothetical protein
MRIVLTTKSLLPNYGGPAFSISRLASALAENGIAVGLWAADQSSKTTAVISPDSPVTRLVGSETEALRDFGRVDVVHDNGIWLPHNHKLAEIASGKRRWPGVSISAGT